MLPIKTNMKREKTNGKYFLPLSPTVSLNNCATKLYISSDINCILVGTSERVLTVSVKKQQEALQKIGQQIQTQAYSAANVDPNNVPSPLPTVSGIN